jgi:hypothetical protein
METSKTTNTKQSAVEWLEEKLRGDGFAFTDNISEQAKEMEKKQQNEWKTVLEEIPPSNIELLVQSPEGINHLASWREGYSIFTCQEKSESSSHWKWKLI